MLWHRGPIFLNLCQHILNVCWHLFLSHRSLWICESAATNGNACTSSLVFQATKRPASSLTVQSVTMPLLKAHFQLNQGRVRTITVPGARDNHLIETFQKKNKQKLVDKSWWPTSSDLPLSLLAGSQSVNISANWEKKERKKNTPCLLGSITSPHASLLKCHLLIPFNTHLLLARHWSERGWQRASCLMSKRE